MVRFASARCKRIAAVCAIVAAATLGGCNLISEFAYIVHDDNTPAEFAGLAEKRVAVVCRPTFQLQFADASAAPDLAALVGELLAKNVKKCKIVPPSEVAMWADSNNWDNFIEIGHAMKADMVVGIDLEDFGLYEGPTLYQGHAVLHVWVYDMHSGTRTAVFSKKLPQTLYPPTAAVSVSDKPEDAFRRDYLGVLSDHIARLFYEHERLIDFATDADSLK
ncbi:MAG TPA: hypothetical protein VHX65_03530 [Pirellulales bacterium]|nr:hypothetical protein [Pirellulales bacterium]